MIIIYFALASLCHSYKRTQKKTPDLWVFLQEMIKFVLD